MPRYLVERRFPRGLDCALTEALLSRVAEANRDAEVAWLCSYVVDDLKSMFCVYEADSPEAVRKAARRAGLPVDVIRRITVLDPYSFKAPRPALEDAEKITC